MRLYQERDYLEPLSLLHPPLIPPTLFRSLTETPYGDLYPSVNRYGPVNHLYGPLRRPLTLLRTTTDLSRPLPPATHYTTLYSMADLRKQVDEGQDKWRQGVNLTSITDVNDYIKFKILEYRYFKLMNNDLWEQYQEDFADFTEAIFKTCDRIAIYNL